MVLFYMHCSLKFTCYEIRFMGSVLLHSDKGDWGYHPSYAIGDTLNSGWSLGMRGVLCFVERASPYELVNKTNLVHIFSWYVYFLVH